MNIIFQSFKRLSIALLLILVASCSGSSYTPIGTVSIYADENTDKYGSCYANGLVVRVSIDGIDLGPIQFRKDTPTDCGVFSDPNLISKNLSQGIHTLSATNGSTCTWLGDFTSVKDTCKLIKLTHLVTAPIIQ